MAINLPQSQTGTYVQNGVRADLLHTLSPYGYGVPLLNTVGSFYSPFYSKPGEILTVADAVKIPAGNITFAKSKETVPSYDYIGTSPTNTIPYLQFDSQRCLSFTFSAESSITSAAGEGVVMTITGFDDRGVKVQEKFQFPVTTKKLTNEIISYKAYSSLESINFSGDITFSKSFMIALSNKYFGYNYYSNRNYSNNLIKITNISSSSNAITTLYGFGFNFRIGIPNATPSVLTENIAVNDPTLFANSQKDARGVFGIATALDSDNTKSSIFSISSSIINSDATLNAIISAPLSNNGSTLPQQAAQRAISASVKDTANTMATPTQLTQFDVFGAQYPGDKKLFNQTFPKANWMQ
jgi:hypothetical protein